MNFSSVGIVGYGNFGQFLVVLIQRFLPWATIRVYSRRHEPDGELFFSLEEVAACDGVFLCGSIREYEAQLLAVLPHISDNTVLVDIATVKVHPHTLFKTNAPDNRWVSAHPMFGPESYEKHRQDVSGFRVVITDYTLPNDAYLQFRDFLSNVGFVVVEMTPEQHDRLLAETLFLTHYIGQTMQTAGFSRTNVDTASFSYLMDAVESVKNDQQLFEDVYRFNPYCQEVAERFHQAQKQVLDSLPKD